MGKGAGSRKTIILEKGAPKITKRSMDQGIMLKRSREHRNLKKEQGKKWKRSKGQKSKGAGNKRGKCKRSKEYGPL